MESTLALRAAWTSGVGREGAPGIGSPGTGGWGLIPSALQQRRQQLRSSAHSGDRSHPAIERSLGPLDPREPWARGEASRPPRSPERRRLWPLLHSCSCFPGQPAHSVHWELSGWMWLLAGRRAAGPALGGAVAVGPSGQRTGRVSLLGAGAPQETRAHGTLGWRPWPRGLCLFPVLGGTGNLRYRSSGLNGLTESNQGLLTRVDG